MGIRAAILRLEHLAHAADGRNKYIYEAMVWIDELEGKRPCSNTGGREDGLYDKSLVEEVIRERHGRALTMGYQRVLEVDEGPQHAMDILQFYWNAGKRLEECLRGLKHGASDFHTVVIGSKEGAAVCSPASQESDVIDSRARVKKPGNSRSHVRLICIQLAWYLKTL